MNNFFWKALHEWMHLLNKHNVKNIISDWEAFHEKIQNRMKARAWEAMLNNKPIKWAYMKFYKSLWYKDPILNYTRKPEWKDELFFENPLLYSAWSDKYWYWVPYNEKIFGWLYVWWITKEYRPWNWRKIWDRLPLPRVGKDYDNLSMTNRFWLNNNWVHWLKYTIGAYDWNNLRTKKPVWYNIAWETKNYAYIVSQLSDTIKEHQAFFELNFSCPNHAAMEWLQEKYDELRQTILAVKKANRYNKPIVVKIGIHTATPWYNKSKDLSEEQIRKIVNICVEEWVDWINATNTSKERIDNLGWSNNWYDPSKELKDYSWNIVWWMSWKLIQDRALETTKMVKDELNKLWSNMLVIGTWWIWADRKFEEVGHHAVALAQAEADLYWMFTGFIYSPATANRVLKALAKYKRLLKRRDWKILYVDNKEYVRDLNRDTN